MDGGFAVAIQLGEAERWVEGLVLKLYLHCKPIITSTYIIHVFWAAYRTDGDHGRWGAKYPTATPSAMAGAGERGLHLYPDSSARKDCALSQCSSKSGQQTTACPELFVQVCEEVSTYRQSVHKFLQFDIAVHFYCIGPQQIGNWKQKNNENNYKKHGPSPETKKHCSN